jgi:hypothetical protein
MRSLNEVHKINTQWGGFLCAIPCAPQQVLYSKLLSCFLLHLVLGICSKMLSEIFDFASIHLLYTALKMEAARSSETFISYRNTTRRHKSECLEFSPILFI